jgi:hypothetical protein
MKIKRLIELLQKEDPTGEGEVVLKNGDDIHFLEWKPGYWDGRYTTLIRDASKEPYYDVVGAQYRSDGNKLCIRSMNWEDVIDNDNDAHVEVIDEFYEKKMQLEVDNYREESKAITQKVYDDFFDDNFPKMIKMIDEGWKIVQSSSCKIGKYNCMWYVKNLKKFKETDNKGWQSDNKNQKKLMQGECGIVINSGKFKTINNKQFIEWELI